MISIFAFKLNLYRYTVALKALSSFGFNNTKSRDDDDDDVFFLNHLSRESSSSRKKSVAELIGVSLGGDGELIGGEVEPEDEEEERGFAARDENDEKDKDAADDATSVVCERMTVLQPGFYAQTEGDDLSRRAEVAPGMAAGCLNTTLRLKAQGAAGVGREAVVRYCAHGAAHHASLRAAVHDSRDAFRVVVEAIDGSAWAAAWAAAAVETKKSKQQKTQNTGGGVIGGPVVVEVGSRDGLLALFAARVGAARVLAVPSDPAAASRQELVAELNGVRRSGGGHAALEVYAAPRGGLTPGETVVRAVRFAAKQQQQRQQPQQQQPQQMVAFLSLAGDGAADPAELLAAAHELFADAAAAAVHVGGAFGGAAAPRVLNVGLEINPLRGSADAAAAAADDDDGVATRKNNKTKKKRACSSDVVAAVWRSVKRFGYEARVLKSPVTDRAGLSSSSSSSSGGGGGRGGALVAAGSFLALRTEGDVRAVVAAAAACACPAYVWLATPDPSLPAVDRGARSVAPLSAAAAALAARARRDPGGAAARKQARIAMRAAEQEELQAVGLYKS
jgi:hypothetical protein